MVDDAVDPKTVKAFQLSEKEFQQQVTELAETLGWRWYHTRDSRGSNPGFPDLVLVRDERIVYLELKRDGETMTPSQQEWATALRRADAEFFCIHPGQWVLLEGLLF